MVVYKADFSGGHITVPPSKSAAHRALLCAALSGTKTKVFNIDRSKDMEAMLNALHALGVSAEYDEGTRCVSFGSGSPQPESRQFQPGQSRLEREINCLESGNTLRFVTPVAAAFGGDWRFTGGGRLPERPMSVYQEVLPEHGVSYQVENPETGKNLPLHLSGRLTPGIYRVPGNISSQFITGFLFALPLLQGDSEIIVTSPLESKGYIDLTLSVLSDFGIRVTKTPTGWKVPGNQTYTADDYTVEGDWSQAAFFLSMAALSIGGEKVYLHGLDKNSVQGDKACISCFEEFGLHTCWKGDVLTAWNPNGDKPFGGLHGTVIDASQINDLVPALAVCGALSEGETRIVHAERLRLKESDRLAAMAEAINRLGGHAEETADGLVIQGVEHFQGGTAEGKNDHRVVMALAAGALRSKGELTVTDEQSIQKTYPGFFEDFRKLGGIANVIHMG